ncbi:tRNA preQ1(34) S-adenosylmethionine ribosyltransferase-isomerase QueA [uncultured Eubacterium sp.]|uniref:tRNA preQ1(34) S-adenosylmethionine ribosyltransferase-isomerase QueA n=1 Tax=uncultured Eubacterium sp. TaxID=165185 RepID=UPI0025F689F3|nr:tRNA preQ1(34) S-adenosylmethionine ribosyltransferase-isomerase QueA [uncultured Eubacterium sp.]
MKTSDFYYDLPQELIAQTPIEPRDQSRLMVVDKNTGEVTHRIFKDLIDYLNPNDCLILNDTRVIPARIYGVKKQTGAVVEFLLLKQSENNVWECLCKPGKRAKIGTEFVFGEGLVECEVVDITDDGNRKIQFKCDSKEIYTILDKIGKMPLPPYITEELKNGERYQTVYSRELGSAAAPTAGLHFTNELLKRIEQKGIKIGYVTLHVGLGTFRPVKVDDVTKHKMHTEHYHVSKQTADLINKTKANGGRVISVGTTSTRTLESVATKNGCICEDEDDTSIFIYPGYEFKCIDGLVTNFHLPESTLIMLISAFAGYDNVMNAYKIAVDERYRFFSFGDACLFIDTK